LIEFLAILPLTNDMKAGDLMSAGLTRREPKPVLAEATIAIAL
jgi:hypothetical protein